MPYWGDSVGSRAHGGHGGATRTYHTGVVHRTHRFIRRRAGGGRSAGAGPETLCFDCAKIAAVLAVFAAAPVWFFWQVLPARPPAPGGLVRSCPTRQLACLLNAPCYGC